MSTTIDRAAEQMSQTVSQLGTSLDRTVKSMIPADQEPRVEEGKRIIRRYLNSPLTLSMDSEISKAINFIKQLKDFPAVIDGKVNAHWEYLNVEDLKEMFR